MTLSRIYGFWKYMTNLEQAETRRYLEVLYALQYRPRASTLIDRSLDPSSRSGSMSGRRFRGQKLVPINTLEDAVSVRRFLRNRFARVRGGTAAHCCGSSPPRREPQTEAYPHRCPSHQPPARYPSRSPSVERGTGSRVPSKREPAAGPGTRGVSNMTLAARPCSLMRLRISRVPGHAGRSTK